MIRRGRRAFITEDDAHAEINHHFDAPPGHHLGSFLGITGTVTLEPVQEGTRLAWRMQITSAISRWLKRLMARHMVNRHMEPGRGFALLETFLVEHAPATAP